MYIPEPDQGKQNVVVVFYDVTDAEAEKIFRTERGVKNPIKLIADRLFKTGKKFSASVLKSDGSFASWEPSRCSKFSDDDLAAIQEAFEHLDQPDVGFPLDGAEREIAEEVEAEMERRSD